MPMIAHLFMFSVISLCACEHGPHNRGIDRHSYNNTFYADSIPDSITLTVGQLDTFFRHVRVPGHVQHHVYQLLDKVKKNAVISMGKDVWDRIETIKNGWYDIGVSVHDKECYSLLKTYFSDAQQADSCIKDPRCRLLVYLVSRQLEIDFVEQLPSPALLNSCRWKIPVYRPVNPLPYPVGALPARSDDIFSTESQYALLKQKKEILLQWQCRLLQNKGQEQPLNTDRPLSLDTMRALIFHQNHPDSTVLTKLLKNRDHVLSKMKIVSNLIDVNLARHRWLGDMTEPDRIIINIPSCSLYYYQQNKCVWASKVIVGKPSTPTVIFKSSMSRIVQNPYWYVPASILRNEIKPLLSRSSHYLQQHNMEWYGEGLRQKPGPQNALGLIKFEFNNPYSIFLHDTPSKALFKQQHRFFSHGCIRLENPHQLANLILQAQEMDVIRLEEKSTRVIDLRKPIPIYLVYFTAWVEKDGQLIFFEDRYKHDDVVSDWLNEKRSRSVKTK